MHQISTESHFCKGQKPLQNTIIRAKLFQTTRRYFYWIGRKFCQELQRRSYSFSSSSPAAERRESCISCYSCSDPPPPLSDCRMVGSLKKNTTLEYSTRVVQEGDRRCKKSTLNDLAYLTPLRIPLMNPVVVSVSDSVHVQNNQG